MEVVWSKDAELELKNIFSEIKKQSPGGAKKVLSEILDQTSKLNHFWNRFREDELKENNDGSYRVCFVYLYRITYKVKDSGIYILRIRHCGQEPLLH